MREIGKEGITMMLAIIPILILLELVWTAPCVLNVIVNVNAAVAKEMVVDATEEAALLAEKLS